MCVVSEWRLLGDRMVRQACLPCPSLHIRGDNLKRACGLWAFKLPGGGMKNSVNSEKAKMPRQSLACMHAWESDPVGQVGLDGGVLEAWPCSHLVFYHACTLLLVPCLPSWAGGADLGASLPPNSISSKLPCHPERRPHHLPHLSLFLFTPGLLQPHTPHTHTLPALHTRTRHCTPALCPSLLPPSLLFSLSFSPLPAWA